MHIHSVRDIGTQTCTIEEAREGHLVTLAKLYGTMEFNDVMSCHHTSRKGQLAKPKVMWWRGHRNRVLLKVGMEKREWEMRNGELKGNLTTTLTLILSC